MAIFIGQQISNSFWTDLATLLHWMKYCLGGKAFILIAENEYNQVWFPKDTPMIQDAYYRVNEFIKSYGIECFNMKTVTAGFKYDSRNGSVLALTIARSSVPIS